MSRESSKYLKHRRFVVSACLVVSSSISRRSLCTSPPKNASTGGRLWQRIPLRRGLLLPQLGFGTGRPGGSREPQVTLEDGRRRLVAAVKTALRTGYRLVDTSLFSGMETAVVEGIRQSGVERSEVVVATKLLQMAHNSSEAVHASVENSLRNLNCSCIDLYLLQSPRAGRILDVWPQLIRLRNEGLIGALGVSNFGAHQLEGMRQSGLELPEVNQVEVHCWRQLPALTEYHRTHGIVTMCMAPLARGEMFGKTEVATIAQELGQTEAAVAVRWCLQMGYIPIPRSVRSSRILENTASGFELSVSQMERIGRMNVAYVACRKASPCCEIPWEAIAESIPDKSLWDESKKRKVEAAERRSQLQEERARKALERKQQQIRAQARFAKSNFLQTRLNFWSTWLPPMAVRSRLHRASADGHYARLSEAQQQLQLVSLGSFCGMKFSIQRLGLGDAHLPFDWIRTTSQGLERFLKHGFDDFFVAKRYDLPEAGMKVHRAEHHSFWHDDVSQPEVREKLLRRVNRFLGLAENTPESRDLLFIRSCACTDELREAEALYSALCGRFTVGPGRRLLLAMVVDGQERYEGPILHAFLPGLAFFLQPLANEQEGTDGKAFSWAVGAACDAALAVCEFEGGDTPERSEVVERLQQQLNALKQKTFKLRRLKKGERQGLLDSGATHPLRPVKKGEDVESYKRVQVALADGQVTNLPISPGGAMVSVDADIEPIIPMGLLTEKLGCSVIWSRSQLRVVHPLRGELPVEDQDGCPQLPRQVALDLIEELEKVKKGMKLKEENDFEWEIKWMEDYVNAHPVLSRLPKEVKESLVVKPGEWSDLPANRRKRKAMKRDGYVCHLYAGADEGFTFERAWKQKGGEERELLEVDIKRGPGHDMLLDRGPYAGLVRLLA
ncbi:unnamed protein product [Durusdinium trenchii]|uniref:NADP-dependent oxidoreductase domain-containing protein n=1 Tax=Durusdinium trenchii TaxID=1381693 RepID=A0ABP0PPX1_9DINO